MRLIMTALVGLALCAPAAAQTSGAATDRAPVSTDATTEGDRATMDGTLPVDASPAAGGGGGGAAQADAANAGATILPTTPVEATTTVDVPAAPAPAGQAPTN